MSGPAIPEDALRARARQLIDKGDIPVLKVADIDGGYGRDHVCSVCAEQISNSQIEYEPRGIVWHRPLRFHIKCFAVWQLECAQRIDTQGGSPPSGTSAIDDPDKTGDNGDGTHRSRSARYLDNGRQCTAMSGRPVTSHLSPGNNQRHGIH